MAVQAGLYEVVLARLHAMLATARPTVGFILLLPSFSRASPQLGGSVFRL